MLANVSMNDRFVRNAMGLGVIGIYIFDPRPVWLLLAGLLLFSGLSGYCPLYHAAGYSTIEVRHSNKRLLMVLMISGIFIGLGAMAVVFTGATPYLWQAMALGSAAFAAAYGSAMGYFCGATCASD